MILDFDCRLRADQLHSGQRVDLSGSENQCAAIADRLGLPAITRLGAHAVLDCKGGVVRAAGRVQAALTLECVVTGELIATHVDEAFDILFTPEVPNGDPGCEIELGPEDCDTVFYDGASIGFGEAIADTLALSVDPFPRSCGAEAALKDAGIMTESEAGPFAALAPLKGKADS